MNTGKLRRVSSLNINDTRIAGLYDLEHTIGKGHFAVVKLARHVFTGEMVAVKVIDKTRLDPVSTAHMMQEVRCMKLVQHPNIIRLYEIIDTQTKLFLILELGDYDMYDYIMKQDADKSGGFKENDAQQYFNQIIKAIDYCHALHVVHRDLKPENVIFFEKLGMVKLTDFGFSNLFTPGQQLQTSCGSLAYSAPEILLGDAYEAPAVDVWSLGVILYMLVCGRLPFQEANESETLTKILDCKFSVPDYISAPCKHLISRMLIRDPSKRATLSEVIESSWVVAGERGHAEALPLIIREHLPESAHSTIVEQMVAGGIGTEDDIVSAIESDMYNYLTATYYLLAERVLAAYRQEQASQLLLNNTCAFTGNYCAGVEDENESNENVPVSATQQQNGPNLIGGRSRSNSWRGSTATRRPCTILKEESEEELSSYLRSSSRQSSRFFNQPQSARQSRAPSRANSTDSFMPEIHQILEDLEDEDICEEVETDLVFPDTGDFLMMGDKFEEAPTFPPHITSRTNSKSTSLFARRNKKEDNSLNSEFMSKASEKSGRIIRASSDIDERFPTSKATKYSSPLSTLAVSIPGNLSFSRRMLQRADAIVDEDNMPLKRNAASIEFGSMKALNSGSIPIAKSGHDGSFPFDSSTTAPSTPASWSSDMHGLLMGNLKECSEKKFNLAEPEEATKSRLKNLRKMKSMTLYSSNPLNISCPINSIPAFVRNSNVATLYATKNAVRGRRFQPPLLRRNSSPSVSMFGGVSVQSSAGLRASRERVSPQAIQELLEFSRISGRRAASPDSRISSRSSSPPCSSGRSSPAVTAIVSRLKASNLLPSVSGMRKLSSSPHLLGICEESEDGSLDYPNTSAASTSTGITHNRSFGGAGNLNKSASIKRRSSRSASIGFAYARNSQRSSDVGMSTGDAKFAELKGSRARCVFSTSFEQVAVAKPSSSVAKLGEIPVLTREREESDDILGDLSPPKVLSTLLPGSLSSGSDSYQHARLKRNMSSSSTCSTQSTRSASAVMSGGGTFGSGNASSNAGTHPRSHSSSTSSTSSSSSQKFELRNTPTTKPKNACASQTATISTNTLRFVASLPHASTEKLPEVFLDGRNSATENDQKAPDLRTNTVTVSTTFSSVSSPPLHASSPNSDFSTEPTLTSSPQNSAHVDSPIVS